MKKSLILVALLSLFVGFSSCEKDETPNVNPNPSQSTSDNDKKEEDKKEEEVKSLVVTFESAVLPECGYLREFEGEYVDIYAEDEDSEDEDAEPLYREKWSAYGEQNLNFYSYANEQDYGYGSIVSYSGFYVSNSTDTETPDYTNDYSVYGDGGANNSKNFAVFYYSSYYKEVCTIADKDAKPFTPKSVYLALTTYCYQSAYNAQNGITKFSSEDFFELEIIGLDKDGEQVASQKIKIIDGENSDFIGWKKVEFDESFANVSKITFKTLSSQKNDWGDLFPSYIALDDFEFVRE